jgi:hypothetical protein
VLQGAIEVQGRPQREGAKIADGSTLRSAGGATLALAQATVELRPGTAAQWNSQQHSLRLQSGSVVADVDPAAHQPFSVETERFSVLVLGTRFEVSAEAVSVTRGRVRVLSPQGQQLALLGAGQRFVVGRSQQAATNAVRETEPGVVTPSHSRGDRGALLGEARAQLAAKQVGRARRALDAAFAQGLTRNERAEAMSLRAECAVVEGNKQAAVSAYLQVAHDFAQLPAGETALFAAARLEAEGKHGAAAARWLARYLARYPAGRFVKEAQARLRELTVSVDHPL